MSTGAHDVLLVICTFPSQEIADRLGLELLRRRLTACVNLLPAATSHYWWDGKITSDTEVIALLKCTGAVFPDLRDFLQKEHPYDVPEVLAIPVQTGAEPYLRWVRDNCSRK